MSIVASKKRSWYSQVYNMVLRLRYCVAVDSVLTTMAVDMLKYQTVARARAREIEWQ